MTDSAEQPAADPGAKPAATSTPEGASTSSRHWPRWLPRPERLRWLPWRTLLLLALALPLLDLAGLIKLPFPPFTTRGVIYVDSPEVYTRERLVNDRYDQDWWLRKQLGLLDRLQSSELIAQRTRSSVTGTLGSTDGETAPPPLPDGEAGAGLTFEQRFRVLTGIRDMIRQQILENMLDDRHDLTGNSVYGLKFDTTVIPGSNTRQRAYVTIQLRPDALFTTGSDEDTGTDTDADGTASAELPPHLQVFVWRQCRQARFDAGKDPRPCDRALDGAADPRIIAQKQLAYYRAWLTDIQKRLNQAEDSLFESLPACSGAAGAPGRSAREAYDTLTRRTLRAVLGIPEERFTIDNPSDGQDPRAERVIRLTDPWASFMLIYRSPLAAGPGAKCPQRVWFRVVELPHRYVAVPRGSESNICRPATPQEPGPPPDDCMAKFGSSADGDWTVQVEARHLNPMSGWWSKFFADPSPKYIPPDAALRQLARLIAAPDPGHDPKTDPGDGGDAGQPAETAAEGRPGPIALNVQAGLLNFVDHLSRLDAYAYAIFPKNDVIGVIREEEGRLSGTSGEGMLGFARRLSESDTESVLVGYGDGRPDQDTRREVRFGWVISPVGELQPTMKTQMALVSVPAWTNTLHLEVETGWVGADGQPIASSDGPFAMTVRVPPDFEAFDSIIRSDAGVSRGPRIQDDAMDQRIYVMAGKPSRILIPGVRLWRSATVTLGPQRADRIRVMPNMEGIIAEFTEVALPYAMYNPRPPAALRAGIDGGEAALDCPLEDPALGGLRARPVRLRVWTSEGVATALRPVCVTYDPARQIRDSAGAPGPAQASTGDAPSADSGSLDPVAVADGADGLGDR